MLAIAHPNECERCDYEPLGRADRVDHLIRFHHLTRDRAEAEVENFEWNTGQKTVTTEIVPGCENCRRAKTIPCVKHGGPPTAIRAREVQRAYRQAHRTERDPRSCYHCQRAGAGKCVRHGGPTLAERRRERGHLRAVTA